MGISLNTNTYVLNATATSSAVTISPLDSQETYLEIYNSGGVAVFIVSGTSAAPTAVFPASSTTGVMGSVVAPGRTATYPKNAGHEFVSVVAQTSTASVFISPGGNIVI